MQPTFRSTVPTYLSIFYDLLGSHNKTLLKSAWEEQYPTGEIPLLKSSLCWYTNGRRQTMRFQRLFRFIFQSTSADAISEPNKFPAGFSETNTLFTFASSYKNVGVKELFVWRARSADNFTITFRFFLVEMVSYQREYINKSCGMLYLVGGF